MVASRSYAWIVILGSLLFLISAFALPNVARIYMEKTEQGRAEILTNHPTEWKIHTVLFVLGTTLTAIGLGLLALSWQSTHSSWHLLAGAALLVIGFILMDWHMGYRYFNPMSFASNSIPVWLFAGYSLLTMVGLALFGFGYLQIGLPSWLGWLNIIGMAALFILAIIFRDMPPFVYYLFTLTAGIVILRI